MSVEKQTSPTPEEEQLLKRIKMITASNSWASELPDSMLVKEIKDNTRSELDPLLISSIQSYLLKKTDKSFKDLTSPTKEILEYYTKTSIGKTDGQSLALLWQSLIEEGKSIENLDLSTPEKIETFFSWDPQKVDQFVSYALEHPEKVQLNQEAFKSILEKGIQSAKEESIKQLYNNPDVKFLDVLTEPQKRIILSYGWINELTGSMTYPLTSENLKSESTKQTINEIIERKGMMEANKANISDTSDLQEAKNANTAINYPQYAIDILNNRKDKEKAYDEKTHKVDISKISPGQIYALRDAGFFIGSIFLSEKGNPTAHPSTPADLTKGKEYIVNLGHKAKKLAQVIGAADLFFPNGWQNQNVVTWVEINQVAGTLRGEPRAGYYRADGQNYGDSDPYMEIWSGDTVKITATGTLDEATATTVKDSLDRQAYETRKAEYLEYAQGQIDGTTETVHLQPFSSTHLDQEVFRDIVENTIYPKIWKTGEKLKESSITLLQDQVKDLQNTMTYLGGGVEGLDGGGFAGCTKEEAKNTLGEWAWCSYCTRQTLARCFGMYDGNTGKANGLVPPKGTALLTMEWYPKWVMNNNPSPENTFITFREKSWDYHTLFDNIPAGADIMDVFMGSKNHPNEGHRVSIHKWWGNWFVMDAYYGGNARPVPVDTYFTKNNTFGGQHIRWVAYHNSPKISDTEANEGKKWDIAGLPWIPEQMKPYMGTVQEASKKYNLPASFILAFIEQESSMKPFWPDSSEGAIGLMQLMPGTAVHLWVNPRNPHENIMGGSKYLREIMDVHGARSIADIMIAYNAGPGAWKEIQAGKRPMPTESRKYIPSATAYYRKYVALGYWAF